MITHQKEDSRGPFQFALDEQQRLGINPKITSKSIENIISTLAPSNPLLPKWHLYYAVFLCKQGKYNEAENHIDAALKLAPKNEIAYEILASIYHQRGRDNGSCSNLCF